MLRRRAALPLLGWALLASSCGFQPVSDVFASLSSQERAAVAAQTSAPSAGCQAKTLEDASCKTAADWEAAMASACAGDGKTASRPLWAGACETGAFKLVAFECCGATVEPLKPACDGGQVHQDGGPTSCKDQATWTSYAEYDCWQLGMAFGGIDFLEECAPGNFRYMRFTCCPSSSVPTYGLTSDFGPSRPDLLGSASGWWERGPGCGMGGECVGFSWAFYPAYLPFEERACKFELYVRDGNPPPVVLSDWDCAAFKRWLTSDVFLQGLDHATCGGVTGQEETGVGLLNDESHHQKKYDGCQEEPFTSHRFILKSLVRKYFPGSPDP